MNSGEAGTVADVLPAVEQFGASLEKVEALLEPLLSGDYRGMMERLTPAEQAKLNILVGYCINTLVYMYLKTKGQAPAQHPVQQELDRTKAYIKKIAALTEPPPKPSMRVDAPAAGRFINHALAEQSRADRRRMEEREDAEAAAEAEEGEEESEEDDAEGGRHSSGGAPEARDSRRPPQQQQQQQRERGRDSPMGAGRQSPASPAHNQRGGRGPGGNRAAEGSSSQDRGASGKKRREREDSPGGTETPPAKKGGSPRGPDARRADSAPQQERGRGGVGRSSDNGDEDRGRNEDRSRGGREGGRGGGGGNGGRRRPHDGGGGGGRSSAHLFFEDNSD